MEVKCYWLELLETVQSTTIKYYYWSLETVQSTPIMTGDWRQCRATRLCRAPLLLLITGDCAEHSYYD